MEEGLPIPVGRKAMPPGDVEARFLVDRDPGRHNGSRCAEVNEAPNERAARGDHLGGEGQRANEGQELTLGAVGALEPSCQSCVKGGQLVLGEPCHLLHTVNFDPQDSHHSRWRDDLVMAGSHWNAQVLKHG